MLHDFFLASLTNGWIIGSEASDGQGWPRRAVRLLRPPLADRPSRITHASQSDLAADPFLVLTVQTMSESLPLPGRHRRRPTHTDTHTPTHACTHTHRHTHSHTHAHTGAHPRYDDLMKHKRRSGNESRTIVFGQENGS